MKYYLYYENLNGIKQYVSTIPGYNGIAFEVSDNLLNTVEFNTYTKGLVAFDVINKIFILKDFDTSVLKNMFLCADDGSFIEPMKERLVL